MHAKYSKEVTKDLLPLVGVAFAVAALCSLRQWQQRVLYWDACQHAEPTLQQQVHITP